MTENATIYGQLQSEKLAKDSHVAREIVKELNHFEINDRQRWLVIYNLALELEDVEEMKTLTSFIRETKGSDLFISRMYGSDEETENG